MTPPNPNQDNEDKGDDVGRRDRMVLIAAAVISAVGIIVAAIVQIIPDIPPPPTSTPILEPSPTSIDILTLPPTLMNTPTTTFTPTIMCVNPSIQITNVPSPGSHDNLTGEVACAEPSGYAVIVFIHLSLGEEGVDTSGWWVKPYKDEDCLLTPIQQDGTWVTDITTYPNDVNADMISAFLVPAGYRLTGYFAGTAVFPGDFIEEALAQVTITR